MEQLRAIIAANVSRLRLERGLTQQELANQLNYSDKAVSKWERGESAPDISVLARIAAIFGVTVDYLITDHRAGRNAEPVQGPSAPAWDTQESAARPWRTPGPGLLRMTRPSPIWASLQACSGSKAQANSP